LDHLGRMGSGCDTVAHLRENGGEKGVMRMVGSGDPREGLGRFGVFFGAEAGAAEMIPEALGMVRIEAHRPPDPAYAFLGPPKLGQQLALLHHDKVIVGIQRKRSLLMVGGLVMIVTDQI